MKIIFKKIALQKQPIFLLNGEVSGKPVSDSPLSKELHGFNDFELVTNMSIFGNLVLEICFLHIYKRGREVGSGRIGGCGEGESLSRRNSVVAASAAPAAVNMASVGERKNDKQ